jgi:hypothetical protein
VRWTRPSGTNARTGIYPAPLYDVFEIPALKRGDRDYRVFGTMRPGSIWIDFNGTPRR